MNLPKYFRKDVSIKTLSIHGKHWFDKVNGNSYNSVQVVVNFGLKNEFYFCLPFSYGYGDYYIQRTIEELVRLGALSDYNKFHELQRNNKIVVNAYIEKHCKQRDVKTWGKE
jgi:hypothetical protein